ncbi:CRAL/TRIO domain-containing protein [Coprinopsis marcescibilis]|uniref:CRAL/TRIO domain-containing protein n=1 Tax=Coprinopsis marcescibilis TaxID=230819 RepID=A0A5C3LAA2_COPMA|nr:CRAL/TRIO domain-containing protein [Coprinopsis marcescibilis]
MEIHDHLRANCEKLLESYHANLQDVEKLQQTLIDDILPSVTDELHLTPDAAEWAKEWILDTASMFRIARRNRFTKSFTLEAVRKNLIWRFQNIWVTLSSSRLSMPNVHCLPSGVSDPFGRPIVIVETVSAALDVDIVKRGILQFFESLQQYLAELFKENSQTETPPLQCIVLIDLSALTFQRAGIEIITWAVREVIPRYPGMLAGVFMLNYSWTHASIWTVVKRVLPATALSRVFFPSQKEILQCLSPSNLPQEYGGELPPLQTLDDPICFAGEKPVVEEPQPTVEEEFIQEATSSSWTRISPTSLINPFFGYPVSALSNRKQLSLHHGRRRKRDLFRTLAVLFWARWQSCIMFSLCISVICLVFRSRLRPPLSRLFVVLKGFVSELRRRR